MTLELTCECGARESIYIANEDYAVNSIRNFIREHKNHDPRIQIKTRNERNDKIMRGEVL
jgi:hypothetical protein